VNNHGNVPLGQSLNIYSDKGVTSAFSIIMISIAAHFFIPPFYYVFVSAAVGFVFFSSFFINLFSLVLFSFDVKRRKVKLLGHKSDHFFSGKISFCCCCECLLGASTFISTTRILT
jgi:hypothetical protein